MSSQVQELSWVGWMYKQYIQLYYAPFSKAEYILFKLNNISITHIQFCLNKPVIYTFDTPHT